MKGFIYFLELAISAILITIILITFFTVRIKQDWERSYLISLGNDIFNYLRNSENIIKLLNNDTSEIDSIIPPNIDYNLKISGSPKSNIKVGCIDVTSCNYINNLLTETYVNNHWVNFTVEQFDINNGLPSDYDAVIFVNYMEYSNPSIKSNIIDYLKKGGIVLGINRTSSPLDETFGNIFNLTSGSGSSSIINFTFYYPSRDKIEKYFLGFGFDGYVDWYIWESEWRIDYGSNYVNITKVLEPNKNRIFLSEGDVFSLTAPDLNNYFFKIRKIWYPTIVKVDFQPLNKSFVFKDFSEKNVKGNNIVGDGSNYAALTTNNSAIWISDFLWSDEYRTLIKAAIASRRDEWYVKQSYPTKETIEISSFVSLCCDMPEIAELTLYLWYKV